MPSFKVECIGPRGGRVVEDVEAADKKAAIALCRNKGLFPLWLVGTLEEEEARERQLTGADDPPALRQLCEAQGRVFQALDLVQVVMGEHPDLRPLLAKHHTYLQLAQLIESLRALTDDVRAQLADADATL